MLTQSYLGADHGKHYAENKRDIRPDNRQMRKRPAQKVGQHKANGNAEGITMMSLVGTRASKMAIFSVQLVILRIITGASTMPILPKTKIPTLPDTIVVKAMPKSRCHKICNQSNPKYKAVNIL